MTGSLVSGGAGYLYQVFGARVLGDEGFAPLGLLWTLQYLVIAVALTPVENQVARAAALSPRDRAPVDAVVRSALRWILAVAAVVALATWLGRSVLLHGHAELLPSLPVAVVTYGGFAILRGRLAGEDRFSEYGRATSLEGLVRGLLVGTLAAVAGGAAAFAWVLPAGPVLLFLVGRWRRAPTDGPAALASRRSLPVPVPDAVLPDVSAASVSVSTRRSLGWNTAANAIAQVLLLGSPLLLVPLGAGPAEVSVFFITTTAARIPLVLAYNGALSRVLPAMARAAQRGPHALTSAALLVTGATLALAGLGAISGAALGPLFLRTLFGTAFDAPGWLAAAAAGGALLATGAQLLGQVLVAQSRERRLVAPWAVGLATALVTVYAAEGGSASARSIGGFVGGELVALLALALAVRPGQSSQR